MTEEVSNLYERQFPAPRVPAHPEGPVLVHALEGFTDAGHALRLATEHLLGTLDNKVIATFDADELIDYRSRRPTMDFNDNKFVNVDAPKLELRAVTDHAGSGFLLLSGAEPDLRWEKFVSAVGQLASEFNVSKVVGLNAVPMAVPHTRPVPLIAHGDAVIRGDRIGWDGSLRVPGSASMLLELRLGEAGFTVGGISAQVPHYLSQTAFPAAAKVLVDSLAEITGIAVETEALAKDAATVAEQIDSEVSENQEISAVVTALENQYDSFVRARESRQSLLAGENDLPTGDELGAELERFLASQIDSTTSWGDDTDSPDDSEQRSPHEE